MKSKALVVLVSFLVILIGIGKNSVSIEATAKSKPESIPEARAFRMYFDKIETAHKIVISMNAIESKYEKGYETVEKPHFLQISKNPIQ